MQTKWNRAKDRMEERLGKLSDLEEYKERQKEREQQGDIKWGWAITWLSEREIEYVSQCFSTRVPWTSSKGSAK